MRRAAERIDDQMRLYMQARAIPGPWHAAERLLVCLSPSPLSERLVRSTRRLADELNAEWFAVYVETPEHARLSQAGRDQLARSLRLAEELGARAKTLPINPQAGSVSGTLLQFARQNNITKIVAGKPLRPAWQELLRGSVVDQLIHHSGSIDIYIITGQGDGKPASETAANLPPAQRRPWRYAGSVALVGAASLLSALLVPRISPTNLVMIFLLAVVIAAVYLGRGPAILASLLSVLVFDFFFVPPQMTFAVTDTEYLLTFLGLLIVGWVISYLTTRAQEQAEAAQRREADTLALYAFSRDLAAAEGQEAVVDITRSHIEQAFGRQAVVFLAEGERLNIDSPTGGGLSEDTDLAVAQWAFQHGEIAGRGTNTLPAAGYRYLPLKTARGTLGVIGVKPKDPKAFLSPDQNRLLEAFSAQAAQAIERAQLAGQARQIELLQAAEKLQNALLNSISHDLRTPLVTITGALTTLEQDEQLDNSARGSLIETAREEAERLNRLVANLLDMTRLESSAIQVKREPCDITDLVGAALGQVDERLQNRPVRVNIQPGLPLVPMDFVLIVHVLINLLDNALKYSPENSPIDISAEVHADEVQLRVLDRGIGIPQEDLGFVFDKFYRVQRPDRVIGTGLGLAIAKGMIDAHSGRIWAEPRPGGGTAIAFSLPLEAPS